MVRACGRSCEVDHLGAATAQDDPVCVAQSSVGISSMVSRHVAAAGFEAATVLYMYHTQHVTVCSHWVFSFFCNFVHSLEVARRHSFGVSGQWLDNPA